MKCGVVSVFELVCISGRIIPTFGQQSLVFDGASGCVFPGGSDSKASVYNVGDLGSISGSESSLEKEMATHSSTPA